MEAQQMPADDDSGLLLYRLRIRPRPNPNSAFSHDTSRGYCLDPSPTEFLRNSVEREAVPAYAADAADVAADEEGAN